MDWVWGLKPGGSTEAGLPEIPELSVASDVLMLERRKGIRRVS